ncbi:hypothetical protein LTR36_009513 [Oleoguttula mirabilis]|uniref:TeaA receptor TeaR n=1 Tax=Oleoguttula mirabilis TaxID=1507867 RepID=A0AAV9JVJ1_9PEZI|nr:hypothetical protein LTR36_009513 [Oleoguttula mirabilis]
MANGGWVHAVPLDETNGFSQPQRTDTLRSQDSHVSGYREREREREPRGTASRRPSDFNIQSDSEATGSRRASIRASNTSTMRKRSRNTLREKPKKGEPSVDDSAWIHRDKLAQIEIQEMEEAGIHVRQSRRSLSAGPEARARSSSRSMSRSGARRPTSKDRQSEQYGEEPQGPLYSSFDDYERKRVSTIPAEEEEQGFDPSTDNELRNPEEIAAGQQVLRQHMIRPSTSRIPISKVSPVPVPQTVVDRDSPLPRSRNGSGAGSGAWDDMQYARRARSNSIGSQGLLDGADGVRTPSRPASSHLRNSNENSPPKARVPSKATPSSGARAVSTASNSVARPTSSHLNKPRTSSVANKRPISSSGHKSRPSTSHAPPEGEAPWIASMYKPDPRLPPEQQMLPTHAKRMMQDQWQKEGKTGTAYDRDLNLLNDKELAPQQQKLRADAPAMLQLDDNSRWKIEPPANDKLSPGASRAGNTSPSRLDKPWPLSPAKSDTKSETGSVRPGTSGGYKITPTIASPPPIERNPNSAQSVSSSVPHNPTPRVPDYDEKDLPEPKKGCCCLVM